jgi:hypothetical protein
MSELDNMMGPDDQTDPRRRSMLYNAMLGMPEDEDPNTNTRIQDDKTGQSAGPNIDRPKGVTTTAPGAGGQDARARLADLVRQQGALPSAPPQMSDKRKLILSIMEGVGTAIAGAKGGGVGAARGLESGIARRHQVEDAQQQDLNRQRQTLSQQIQSQSQFIDREDMERERMEEQEHLATQRMTLQEKMFNEGETARYRLAGLNNDAAMNRQKEKFTHDEEMEDQKQQGRMAVTDARVKGQEAIKRIQAAAAASKMKTIPPLVGKAKDDYEDAVSRYNVMQQNYEEAIRDPGNQQAMLSLLTNHIGMTLGAQKGGRITQAILNEAIASGYVDERVEAHFGPDGVMTGVVLTPRQMKQMVGLGQNMMQQKVRKLEEMETYFHVPAGGNGPSPSSNGAGASGPPPGAKVRVYNPNTRSLQ